LEKCWEQNVEVLHLFIDFQASYGTLWRKEIQSEILKLGFPKKLVKLYRILNIEICAVVKTGKHLSLDFIVNKGLRQGDAITPLFFKYSFGNCNLMI